MKGLNSCLLILVTALAVSFSVFGDPVRVILNDYSAIASSSYSNSRYPKYAVNGAGLTNGQHSAQAADEMTWLSAKWDSVSNQWFRIDLGEVMPIHHVKIWNFNWHFPTTQYITEPRSIKDVEFYVSSSMTDPGHYFTNSVLWTKVLQTTLDIAPGLDTYTGEPDISFDGVEGRWLMMHPLTNHGGETYAGISEIQVFAEGSVPGWNKHLDVTLSGYTGSSTLTDFPCVLRLSEDIPGFKYRSFSSPSDGADLRVTSFYGTPLPYEIEKWDPSGTSIVWVAVADLHGPSSTISLHWNNPEASMPDYATNGTFWAGSYGGVWHLDQSGTEDSTTNRNDGTAHGNIMVPGLLGDGQYFDGNDYIQVADDASIGAAVTNSQTVSMWFKPDATLERTNEVDRLLEKGDCYFIAGSFNNYGGVSYLVKKNGEVDGVGSGSDISSNEWHYVCCTFDGTDIHFFMDGVHKNSKSFSGPIDDDGLPLRIGSDDSGRYFRGVLDETRIESVARSTDWIKASYDNQKENSGFLEYSAVYPAPPAATLMLIQ